MNKKITILDTSLRDGAQGEGISFSLQDKAKIIKALDNIGLAIIEAGSPYSNQKDEDFFKSIPSIKMTNAKISAFGSTRRKDLQAENDPSCKALLNANTSHVSIFGKASAFQVKEILKTSLKNNIRMIYDTCKFFVQHKRSVIFDAEHFFDGYKDNPSYAFKCIKAAIDAGANTICLCDTNGGNFPDLVAEVTKKACEMFPNISFGIHAHNDSDLAVAVSIAAVTSGANHVQGTFLGYGERCGNASLSSIIPNLQLKLGYKCIPDEKIALLTSTAREIAEISNISIKKNTAFIGASAFTHKAGTHTDAVIKKNHSFEHINPKIIGNNRRFLISEISGRASILHRILKTYPNFDKNSPETEKIIETIKEKEYKGYQFEGADGSVELIIRRHLSPVKEFFKLISYKVLSELPYDSGSATATIKLKVGNNLKITAAEGEGPINALDKSLREALAEFYPCLNEVNLVDYKVRVMESNDASAAQVRVLITSADSKSDWTTIGVSSDIIEASWLALVDSIEYKLLYEI